LKHQTLAYLHACRVITGQHGSRTSKNVRVHMD
jgi:hypothetical protein